MPTLLGFGAYISLHGWSSEFSLESLSNKYAKRAQFHFFWEISTELWFEAARLRQKARDNCNLQSKLQTAWVFRLVLPRPFFVHFQTFPGGWEVSRACTVFTKVFNSTVDSQHELKNVHYHKMCHAEKFKTEKLRTWFVCNTSLF